MTKTSQDNNLYYIHFLKHFYEYHTEKLTGQRHNIPPFKDFAMMNLLFCSHIQSLVELASVIVATAPYFEHTAPLTYSLWILVFE